ncbi:hypothetical protein PCASD_17345 [Puccinia coronata f. sp. avenae]|uniref:Uncharacterized protein n=1 Tax=Puccinia coronata f. sp. avenae TaxID=200324 RepID=A0A2N5U6Q3_9BASI|nr:hypothetical protein PCASD_17345 [Puccinia coronata f. sp. avenae]
MSNKNKKQTSNPISSTSEIPIQSGSSSPSIPNQTGKSTKERIDEQIGTLKDALAIPFLASPPQSSHEDGTKIPTPPKPTTKQTSQTLPPQFHYTPYAASPSNTTYYDIRQPSVQPHPISSPYHHPATMASAIPTYLQPSHMNTTVPNFQYHTPPHQPFPTTHQPSSSFLHETATPRPHHHQSIPYARPDPRQEQLDRAIEEARQR